jgi:hypothetical protein
MKSAAIAAATILAAFATGASAQTYYERPSYAAPPVDQECFNPRAGHFERVRPGESQGDLDFRRCRAVDSRDQECFNPRTGGFERVRPGETQNDLDFRRCHFVGYAMPDGYATPAVRESRTRRQECWNPRARHYEEVRPGEEQNDLDFDRCRLVR